jgi:hypothetical protein
VEPRALKLPQTKREHGFQPREAFPRLSDFFLTAGQKWRASLIGMSHQGTALNLPLGMLSENPHAGKPSFLDHNQNSWQVVVW